MNCDRCDKESGKERVGNFIPICDKCQVILRKQFPKCEHHWKCTKCKSTLYPASMSSKEFLKRLKDDE